jgi:hypothetical protein
MPLIIQLLLYTLYYKKYYKTIECYRIQKTKEEFIPYVNEWDADAIKIYRTQNQSPMLNIRKKVLNLGAEKL